MIYFTQEQLDEIVKAYKEGASLKEIGLQYSVSRAIIKRVISSNYPAYTGKKRVSIAKENQTKICSKCGKELLLEAFNKGNSKYGRRSFCRECEHKIQNTPEKVARRRELELLRRQNPEYVKKRNEVDKVRKMQNLNSLKKYLLRSAKQRAKARGLEFNIDLSDIELPTICPLLGIPLKVSSNKATDNSYSLDRIDSSKGYVKGNVWVISRRANTLKNNATVEELELLVTNLKKKIHTLNN